MKLIIKRDQKQEKEKGFFGGDKGVKETKFLLTVRIELTPEERSLIAKYKIENTLLTDIEDTGDEGTLLYLRNLVEGVTFEWKNVASALKVEDEIKQTCQNFKTTLTVMASFGGEEVIEF